VRWRETREGEREAKSSLGVLLERERKDETKRRLEFHLSRFTSQSRDLNRDLFDCIDLQIGATRRKRDKKPLEPNGTQQ
jgi:hypothetical protein